MRFEVTIDCDNQAFDDPVIGENGEVARILRDLAARVESGVLNLPHGMETWAKTLHDANGNDVGRATYRQT